MKAEYSTKPNESDWRYVLDNSKGANVLQSIPYVKTQKALGCRIYYLCAYNDGIPCSLVLAKNSTYGKFDDALEIGSRSGGCPLIVDGIGEPESIGEKTVEEFDRKVIRRVKLKSAYFYSPFYLNLDKVFSGLGYSKQDDCTLLLDLTNPVSSLWRNLGKKCRNAIRSAQRSDIGVEFDNSPASFDMFYELYRETSERHGFRPVEHGVFKGEFKAFSKAGIADLWLSKKEGKYLSGAIIMKFRDKADYMYAGSSAEDRKYKPNNLLQWEIIKHYKSGGYATYNMWGVAPLEQVGRGGMDGYGRFKLSFGPEIVRISRFVRDLMQDTAY